VRQTLSLLDGEFSRLANGVAEGRYGLWLGSGISREQVPDLRRVILQALAYLQRRGVGESDTAPRFRAALMKAFDLVQVSDAERAQIDIERPPVEWPVVGDIVNRLANNYAKLLDIRIEGESPDFMLWEAIDVVGTYADPSLHPDAEHLCLGLLILEGVAPKIVSANWDGLLEVAVVELVAVGTSQSAALRICVRDEDLRELPGRSMLYKIHGCAILARSQPDVYRTLLIAQHSQLMHWALNKPPIFGKLKSIAVERPTLMIGLSAQDENIRQVFVSAQHDMPWRWPEDAQACVFAEDVLSVDQVAILRQVYGGAYEAGHGNEIEKSARLPAFAKPLLLALVLHVLSAKLSALITAATLLGLADSAVSALAAGVRVLRDQAADSVKEHHLDFVRVLVARTSYSMSLFQRGAVDSGGRVYRPIGSQPVQLMASEPTLETSGLRELAVALGILGIGVESGTWALDAKDSAANAGALRVTSRDEVTRIFFVANSTAAVALISNGYLAEDDSDVVVIHSARLIEPMTRSSRVVQGRTGRYGRRDVSIQQILAEASGIDLLVQRFQEEASL
jgi:hypothetical protein